MARFAIFAGCFNEEFVDIVDCATEAQACNMAWEVAVEDYNTYAGMHGIRTVEEIMEEEDINDEDNAQEIFNEECESTIRYHVVEVTCDLGCANCDENNDCEISENF